MNKKKNYYLFRKFSVAALLIVLVGFSACKTPQEPRELNFIEKQQRVLLKAGAVNYSPNEYKYYRTAYWNAKGAYDKECGKIRWFRDYTDVSDQLRVVLGKGNKILARINKINQDKADEVKLRLASLKEKVYSLKQSTASLNEAWLLRRSLSRAEILLDEAERYHKKGDFDSALTNLTLVNTYSSRSMSIANSILGRYMDKSQLARWKNMAQDTIEESRRRGIVVLIVSKIDQTLMVYKNGKQIGSYNVGLGRNGLKDKLYSGDGATPEGKYHVVKKNAASRYYKALLLNYPNEEDRARFAQAKKKGIIPTRAGIGSLIEIHGGGTGGMTRGCISLDNNDMEKLFTIAHESTPITIVGAVNGTRYAFSGKKDKFL